MRHVFSGALALGWVIGVTSCGSRTGLFLDEPLPDAALDLPDARDAARDVVDEPTACIPGSFALTPAIPQLMFVLDRSGSMKFELTSDDEASAGEPSRWSALRGALAQTISPFSNDIAMGARFFPSADADSFDAVLACMQDPPSAAIVPALGNAPTILGVFSSTSPVGGTPTADAVDRAAQEISSSRAVSRAIVLATDGAPNCNGALDQDTCTCTSVAPTACSDSPNGATSCLDDARTVKVIAETFADRKIPVYVIGIGVTASFANTLDAMAVAGGRPRSGTPRYYAATTPAELTSAFGVIRDSVAKCSYITPSSPTDPNAIVVELDGKVLVRDPSHAEGWDWIDQAYGHLQLFGAACDAASATNVSGTVSCGSDR
jgi:hypothetical protein